MRKVVISLVTAASLLFTTATIDAKATAPVGQASTETVSSSSYTYEAVTQVSSTKASKKTGSFKLKHNTNVRTDAGTKNKIVVTAKKGSTATATHQKKVGKETWYKVKVSGKTGWVLSSLLTPAQASKAPAKKAAPKTSNLGTFTTQYNSNVRSNAGTKYKIVTNAKKGTKVTATAQKKVGKTTWYKVKANGKTGWVSADLLKKGSTAKAPAKKAAPKTSNLGSFTTKYNSNVRSNAGTKNKIVTTAKKGTKVTATAQKKVGKVTWYKVKANGKTGWVSADLLKKASSKSSTKKASNSASSNKVIDNAMKLRGIPYRYGGSTTSGFDCSGFVQYVFKQSGKNVPRATTGQYAATEKVSNPQPGDLVFFAGTYRSGISHVGIYIGNNQFIHSGGKNVHVRSLSDPYWSKYFHSFRSFK